MADRQSLKTTNASLQDQPGNAGVKATGVVGIGASAGGLEALETFFAELEGDSGLAFIVIQHLSPDYKSLLPELLTKHTTMPVLAAEDNQEIFGNHVYVLPPKKLITLEKNRIRLQKKGLQATAHFPIDLFFISQAEAYGANAIGIILSGTGSDGSKGIVAIKKRGGLVLVQKATSAKFDGMPQNAMATGVADFILAPEQMPDELLRYTSKKMLPKQLPQAPEQAANDKRQEIFNLIRNQKGIDFSQYKANTVSRRIQRRMDLAKLDHISDYFSLLLTKPQEINQLCREMLIGVTSFFRDKDAFFYLRDQILPKMLKAADPRAEIRIWVAGCSSGEEAYTLAILLTETMEETGNHLDVKIFATDVDQEALALAAEGYYPESIAADIPASYLSRYFSSKEEGYKVTRRIREMIVFAPQNLAGDPPFTRLNLISCRNLLIYLEPELQNKIFSLFTFALRKNGYLLLGGSEALGDYARHFKSINNKWKIFQLRSESKNALAGTIIPAARPAKLFSPSLARQSRRDDKEKLLEAVLDSIVGDGDKACIVVNESFQVVYTFGQLDKVVSFTQGKATLDILKIIPTDLALAISTGLHRCKKEEKAIKYQAVAYHHKDQRHVVDLLIHPLRDTTDKRKYTTIIVQWPKKEEQRSPEAVNMATDITSHIADLESDLSLTRENLQATVEELETSNEELQAANEELLSANEELQSTNEELQSVNEELLTVNNEYQQKLEEVMQLNNDITNLMRCSEVGSVFLDSSLRIRRYTLTASDYINIIDRDIDRAFFDLSHRLAYDYLEDDTRTVLSTGKALEKEIHHHNGKPILLRILPYQDEKKRLAGVILNFTDLTAIRNAELQLLQMKEVKDLILETIPIPILYYGCNGKMMWANLAAFTFLGQPAEKLLGLSSKKIWQLPDNDPVLEVLGKELPTKREIPGKNGRSLLLRYLPIKDQSRGLEAVLELAVPQQE